MKNIMYYHGLMRQWRPPHRRTCIACGERFISYAYNMRYCSDPCAVEDRHAKTGGGLISVLFSSKCIECDSDFSEFITINNKAVDGPSRPMCRTCTIGRGNPEHVEFHDHSWAI